MVRKVSFLLVVFSLFYQITASEVSKNVPVFIVDNERSLSSILPSKSPFSTLTGAEFSDIVKDALRKSDRVIIFVDDMLSAEDVSSRDQFGSPYYLLRQGLIEGTVKYFPSVNNPFNVLQDHVPLTQLNTFHLDSKTSKLRLYESDLRHVYVFFKDGGNMSRLDSLREHDLIMREVHYVVKQRADGPVVAFYTGTVNPNAVDKDEDSPFAWDTRRSAIWCRNSKAILAVEGIRIIHKNEAIPLPPTDLGQVACTYRSNREDNPDEMTVEMPLTSFILQCRFTFDDITWTLENCHLRPGMGEPGFRSGEGSHLVLGKTLRYANTFQHNEPFDFRRSGEGGIILDKITVEVLKKPKNKFSFQINVEADSKGGGGFGEGDSNTVTTTTSTAVSVTTTESGGGVQGSNSKSGGPKADEETPDGQDPPIPPENPDGQLPKKPEEPAPENQEVPAPEDLDKPQNTQAPQNPDKPQKNENKTYIFTEPLLTCLFISSILLSILIYGFSTLAAVHSNSRYDDPKGKPLMFAES